MKNVDDIYPLSPLQEGMLFHTLKEPDSGAYFEQYYCRLSGHFQPDLYRRAWQSVINRYSILRTAFVWQGLDQPLQIVRGQVALDWVEEDLSQRERGTHDHWLAAYLNEDRGRGFDLSKAPLMRFRLFRLGNNDYQWIWSYHHILSDGWSTTIILEEVSRAYDRLVLGKQNGTLKTPRSYRDYIVWLQSADLSRAERFWKAKLKGFTHPTTIPLRRPVEGISGYQQIETRLSAQLTAELNDVSKQCRITLNTLMQGAWAILLHRYTGDNDVVFGSTVSGRSAAVEGIEQMVGLFINTLPVRAQIDPERSLRHWLVDLQANEMAARHFEYSPLSKIQSWSSLRPAEQIFETIVVFENYPNRERVTHRMPEVELKNIRYNAHSNYPLAFIVMPDAAMRLIIVYDRSRFDNDGIHRIFGHFKTLLQSFVEKPDRLIKNVSIVSENERHLLTQWQNTTAAAPDPKLVHRRFEAIAASQPQAMAVVWKQDQIDYDALNRRANRLAHFIHDSGRGPGHRIGIFLHRSIDMITAILGVIKSGAAYVPLDPAYPSQRLAYMIADAGITAIVTLEAMVPQLPEPETDLVLLDDDRLSSSGSDNPEDIVHSEDLAYVIYTSGSTGRPKGVMINHGNLAYSTHARLDYYPRCQTRFLLLSSISFDSSVAGLFGTLCMGGTLHVPDQDHFRDMDYLSALIQQRRITHMLCVPSLYNHMLEFYPSRLGSLDTVITAGEDCPPALVRDHFAALPQTALYNEYGPTEATVWSTVHRCQNPFSSRVVSIGRPIAATRLYILGGDRQFTPAGIPGEIYIGGPGIAQGYLNLPARTADRFVSISINGEIPERLYRTGDMAYYTEDGDIVFVGRGDEQVKLHGYRIELGEVNDILQSHERVRASAVLAQTDSRKRPYITAYVVARETDEGLVPALRNTLGAQLPDFMIPAKIIPVEAIPLTVNGKIDREALSAIGRTGSPARQASTPPRNDLEAEQARIWANRLDLDTVGVTDSFFELGGDSLLALRLIADIKQETGKDIPLALLFRNPTIAQLVRATTRQPIPTDSSLIAPVQPKGDKIPLFLIQGTDTIHLFLHADQPVYRLLSLYDDIDIPNSTNTIEKIAADYIRDLRRYFPDGPYAFCGFSAGAVIAVEIARQLRENHQETSYLFLLEPTPPSVPPSVSPTSVGAPVAGKKGRISKFISAVRQEPAYALALVINKLKRRMRIPTIVYYGLLKFCKYLGVSVPWEWKRQYALRFYVSATARYRHKTYNAPCTLCLSTSHENTFPWTRIFSGEVKIYRVEEAQKHSDLTHNKEIIRIWANHLNSHLDRIHKSHETQ